MLIGTSMIKYLEKDNIGIMRECHLCGEEFCVGIYDNDTICSRCKELWKEIIESKERKCNEHISR